MSVVTRLLQKGRFCHKFGDDERSEDHRPGVPEIEVTPEMTLAGELMLSAADTRVEDTQEILVRVFRAMWAARESASSNSPQDVCKEQTPHRIA